MKKIKSASKPKAKRKPREDMNQIAYRTMQETIQRSELPFPEKHPTSGRPPKVAQTTD